MRSKYNEEQFEHFQNQFSTNYVLEMSKTILIMNTHLLAIIK